MEGSVELHLHLDLRIIIISVLLVPFLALLQLDILWRGGRGEIGPQSLVYSIPFCTPLYKQ